VAEASLEIQWGGKNWAPYGAKESAKKKGRRKKEKRMDFTARGNEGNIVRNIKQQRE